MYLLNVFLKNLSIFRINILNIILKLKNHFIYSQKLKYIIEDYLKGVFRSLKSKIPIFLDIYLYGEIDN